MKLTILFISLFILSGCSLFNISKTPVENVFKISDIQLYGTLWNSEYNKYNIISQDGGSSFSVPGGSIWCFGDTFKGMRDTAGKPHFKGGAVSCSIAFLPEGVKPYPPKLEYLTNKNGIVTSPFKYLGKENSKENRIWPLAGIYLNGKSYLYYTVIETGGRGSWDFKHIGSGLSVSGKSLGHYKRIIRNNSWKFPINPSSIIKTTNRLYFYSIKNTGKNVQGVFLSRVKISDIENPDAYEYYCVNDKNNIQHKFSKDIRKEKVMLPGIYGQTSVVWNNYLQKYILASSSSFWYPQIIKFYVSDNPIGPWLDSGTKIEIPIIRQDKKVEVVYCSFFHPDLFEQNGKIMYLTYSLMLKDSGFDANCEMVKFEIEFMRK